MLLNRLILVALMGAVGCKVTDPAKILQGESDREKNNSTVEVRHSEVSRSSLPDTGPSEPAVSNQSESSVRGHRVLFACDPLASGPSNAEVRKHHDHYRGIVRSAFPGHEIDFLFQLDPAKPLQFEFRDGKSSYYDELVRLLQSKTYQKIVLCSMDTVEVSWVQFSDASLQAADRIQSALADQVRSHQAKVMLFLHSLAGQQHLLDLQNEQLHAVFPNFFAADEEIMLSPTSEDIRFLGSDLVDEAAYNGKGVSLGGELVGADEFRTLQHPIGVGAKCSPINLDAISAKVEAEVIARSYSRLPLIAKLTLPTANGSSTLILNGCREMRSNLIQFNNSVNEERNRLNELLRPHGSKFLKEFLKYL